MTSKNQVTLTFAGDSEKLERAAERARRAAEGFADGVEDSSRRVQDSGARIGEGFDRAGEGADTAEQRILGVRDVIDGTAAIMQGPGEAGISAYLQGWADLASGIVNFAVPALQAATSGMLTQIKTAATAAAATVASIAKQVAAWVTLGAQSTIQAAKVAAAWLISMGPIALVIAAVVGLVAVIVANWDTIERVIRGVGERIMSWARTAWSTISDLVSVPFRIARDLIEGYVNTYLTVLQTAVDLIRRAWEPIQDIITAPFRAAFALVRSLWNNTLGGREIVGRIEVPSWVPGVGGRGFGPISLPRLHSGGIVPGPAGVEVPIMAMAGERVVTRGAASGGYGGAGTVILNVSALDPRTAAEATMEALTRYVRDNGPSRLSGLTRGVV